MRPKIDPLGLYFIDEVIEIPNIGLTRAEIEDAYRGGCLKSEGMPKKGPRFRGYTILDFLEDKTKDHVEDESKPE
jgi:hypothetical protein